ncbi:MAG: HEAT repeat domain-containing protein, partial [candidate division KSB1 bacterium]|nr:HEAT repeat domain-containing protein [candidate division KSB1 bacterium]
LEQVGPALEQVGPALEQAMREMEFGMQELHHHLPELMLLPPMPPLPSAPSSSMLNPSVGNFFSKAYAENLTDDEQIKIQALDGLLSQDEKTALPEIKQLARQHPNWAMRAAAVGLLAEVESPEALTILSETLQHDNDHRVRLTAVRALSNRSEPETREALKRLLLK